jgi:hypothetical protein
VVQGLKLSSWAQEKIRLTNDELVGEREVVKDLL